MLVTQECQIGVIGEASPLALNDAAEPIIPLTLFRDPIIAVCSVAAFVLGVGMFGTIIYLPLFMQGVLGVSATQSGNLLTPLLMARGVSRKDVTVWCASLSRYLWAPMIAIPFLPIAALESGNML